MNLHTDTKIQAHHLKRKALVYVRQSTMRQVFENTESTSRQYALSGRAVDLGWTANLVQVIDDDLGKSGSSAENRSGFQKLVADVAMGQVGMVMGLEISRLARNNADFQQLLQICGANNTLIYDADAVYDLMRLNDRLILGLKGTMSEAELFTIRARLQGGILNKALRGDLKTKLPVGYVYSPVGEVTFDPDLQVKETISLFFQTFLKVGSAKGVVRHFYRSGIKFPVRPDKGPDKGQIAWRLLSSGLALRILHNPRYAGAYSYGRTKLKKSPSGGAAYSRRPMDQWHSLVKEKHPAYITWDTFEATQALLRTNRTQYGNGAAREGRGLLQGIVICGICGKNFATTYKKHSNGDSAPVYLCNREQLDYGTSICTYIPGSPVDQFVGEILLEKMTPIAVNAAILVQKEITKRTVESDKMLHRHVERAQYEADLARRRVMSVDPENRLVAQTFEDEWNKKLSQLEQAKMDYEKKRASNKHLVDESRCDEIKNVVSDFAKIWAHPATSYRDKKRLVRVLIEDVTIKRERYEFTVFVRFKGGAVIQKTIQVEKSGNKTLAYDKNFIDMIDHMANNLTPGNIAKELNEKGLRHPTIGKFNTNAVNYLLKRFKLSTPYDRLRAQNYLSQEEVASGYGVDTQTVRRWRKMNWINARPYNDMPEYLYEPVFDGLPKNIASQYQPSSSTF